MSPAPYRPEQFTLSLHDKDSTTKKFDIPGQGASELAPSVVVLANGSWLLGLFWEADECARQIRDGKLQSERYPLKDSITFMEVLDEVRKQGGLSYPAGLEDVRDDA